MVQLFQKSAGQGDMTVFELFLIDRGQDPICRGKLGRLPFSAVFSGRATLLYDRERKGHNVFFTRAPRQTVSVERATTLYDYARNDHGVLYAPRAPIPFSFRH